MRADQAVENFNNGYSCSQAVLAAFAEDFGIDGKTVLAIARGFGGGMGHTGRVCGAVSGAVMVIGLDTRAEEDNSVAKKAAYATVQDFLDRFFDRNGSIQCCDLLGCDLSDPEGAQMAADQDLYAKICSRFVYDAVEILEQILEQ